MILENEERGAEDQLRRVKRRLICKLGHGKREKEQLVHASNTRNKEAALQISCLPNDVMYCVLDKLLELVDYVRFAAVCKKLRMLCNNYNLYRQRWLRMPELLPLLMLPPNESENDSTDSSEPQMKQSLVYSVSERKLYNNINIGLSLPYNEKFCGSSHGWLASTLKSTELEESEWLEEQIYEVKLTYEEQLLKVTYDISLWNPFGKSSEVIHLPSYTHCHRKIHHHLEEWIPRIILSANPALHPENYYVLFALCRPMPNPRAPSPFDYPPPLALIKGGQEFWITINHLPIDLLGLDDAIFYKDKVCLLVDTTKYCILTLDVNSLEIRYLRFDPAPDFPLRCWERYLVESTNGDLLLVFRFCVYYEISFAVCKFVFNESKSDLAQLLHTTSIGDDAIFVGQCQSQSVLASSTPGCKPNCIYFATESVRRKEHPDHLKSDMGIFNLGDMTITTLLDADSINNWNWNEMNMPFWILPSLNVSLLGS